MDRIFLGPGWTHRRHHQYDKEKMMVLLIISKWAQVKVVTRMSISISSWPNHFSMLESGLKALLTWMSRIVRAMGHSTSEWKLTSIAIGVKAVGNIGDHTRETDWTMKMSSYWRSLTQLCRWAITVFHLQSLLLQIFQQAFQESSAMAEQPSTIKFQLSLVTTSITKNPMLIATMSVWSRGPMLFQLHWLAAEWATRQYAAVANKAPPVWLWPIPGMLRQTEQRFRWLSMWTIECPKNKSTMWLWNSIAIRLHSQMVEHTESGPIICRPNTPRWSGQEHRTRSRWIWWYRQLVAARQSARLLLATIRSSHIVKWTATATAALTTH